METENTKTKKANLGIRWTPEAMDWLKQNRLEVEFFAKHGISLSPASMRDNVFIDLPEKKAH